MAQNSNPFANRTPEALMNVTFEMGRLRVTIDQLLNYTEGTLIELDRIAGETCDVRINNLPFGKGEVVTIGEQFGIRFTEIYEREQ